jgi:hypothetical protein
VAAGRTRKSTALSGPLLAVVGVQLAYLACVGGDHFEVRFLDPAWPGLAILSVAGVSGARANAPRINTQDNGDSSRGRSRASPIPLGPTTIR